MPRKPMRPCKHPGCSKLTETNYCEKHQQIHGQDRLSAAERGYDGKWRKARKSFLSRNPLCNRCKEKGLLVEATVVDHIIPHRGDKALFWDENNWQSLCKRCHDKKTMAEDRHQVYNY